MTHTEYERHESRHLKTSLKVDTACAIVSCSEGRTREPAATLSIRQLPDEVVVRDMIQET